MTTERAKDFKGTLRQLLAAMSKYKLSLVVVIVFAVLSTIFNIAGPKILAKATTALATGWIAKLRGVGGIDFAYIGKVLLFLLGMYLLSAAFSFIQGWLMSGLSQKVCYDFRDQISKKINRLPLAYFEKRTVGEVLSRITNDVDTLGQSLNQSVTQLITRWRWCWWSSSSARSISRRSRRHWALSTVRSRRSTPATTSSRRSTARPPCWTTSTPQTISCTNPRGNRSFCPV